MENCVADFIVVKSQGKLQVPWFDDECINHFLQIRL